MDRAPKSVARPATIQTRMSSPGEPSCVAIRPGFLKTPEAMTEPTPQAMAVIMPSSRLKPTSAGPSLPPHRQGSELLIPFVSVKAILLSMRDDCNGGVGESNDG